MSVPEYLLHFDSIGKIVVEVKNENGGDLPIKKMAMESHQIDKLIDPDSGEFVTCMAFDEQLFDVLRYKIKPYENKVEIWVTPQLDHAENQSVDVLEKEQLQRLFDEYSRIVKMEIEEFGCKPTEVRHLLGRLGEFYCALHVNGRLTHEVNQHGFDVIGSDNRKISVKTTAQRSGFFPINKNTIGKAQYIMLLQYENGELHILYYGDINEAVKGVRLWNDKYYELDISKAKQLQNPKL